jgi:hypothetical protein
MENNYVLPQDVRARQMMVEKLVETPMGVTKGTSLTEAKGWKEIVEHIVGDERKQLVAMMLENNKNMLVSKKQGGLLAEDSQSIQVGNWEKFGFPVISMVAENLITPELVSVQPLQGPSGNVFYMDFVVGQTKGNIKKGDPVWNSRAGHGPFRDHSTETIPQEQIGLGDGSTTGFSATLSYGPVRAGTVQVQTGTSTFVDNGNGVFAASGILASGTVNYQTGAISLTFGTAPASADPITATYEWNSEGSTNLPQMNFQITSAPIYARRHALRGRWSFEAEQMLMALHGLKAEGQLSAAISAEIQFEIDREILGQLWNIAGAGKNTWSATPPTGVTFTEHKLSFVDAINELSMFIYRATTRVMANWVLVGVQGAAILINHPLFDAASSKSEVDGVTFLGTLNKQYKVYVDPHTNPDEYLVGYKGENFMRTGYIFAPWLLLYSTQTIALDDLTYRKAFASSFGRKPVNSKYYAKGSILNYPTTF